MRKKIVNTAWLAWSTGWSVAAYFVLQRIDRDA